MKTPEPTRNVDPSVDQSLVVPPLVLPADAVDRERSIPIRPGDLCRLLLAEPGLTADASTKFRQFERLLGATFHFEFYDWLCELKDLYAPLDPDSDCVDVDPTPHPFSDGADEVFLRPFETALVRANFRALDLEVIQRAVAAPNELGLTYSPDFTRLEHLRVYVRGNTRLRRTVRSFRTRYRRREVLLDGYERVVVSLKFKDGDDLDQFVRSDVVYLRLFKDVPHVDMEMHLPEQVTKVRMRMIDKAQIASPIFMGPPLVALQVFMGWVSPLAFGALLAPFSAAVHSFFGFRRAKQRHLLYTIRHLYYLTQANNASVINRVIDCAEEEEFKETLLAYHFLWRGRDDPEPWDQARLDATIEAFIADHTNHVIDFEVADAVRKLVRLGLAECDAQGCLRALPIERALVILDEQWDNAFRFADPDGRRSKPRASPP